MQRNTKIEEELLKKVCCFCNTDEVNELKLGPFKWKNDISVHYYCLLASKSAAQRGRDNEGIAGFLLPDIRREIRRCCSIVCVYCSKTGATVSCDKSNCTSVFHLPCGLRNGSLTQFNTFLSYCEKHRPFQEIQKITRLLKESQREPWLCVICLEHVSPTNLRETLWGPCCKKAVYHRDCTQILAINSGYLFRCPLCNDKSKFRLEMLSQGIYIPMQDASWELEPNAYHDQLVRYSKCDALECVCRYGRQFKRKGTRWDVVLCKYCGSQGVHVACGFLTGTTSPSWECNTCRIVAKGTRQSQVQHKYGSRYISKSADVAMVQQRSANWREEIYSRARPPSRRLDTDLNPTYRVTVHPDLLPPRPTFYGYSNGLRNHHLDKTICSNYDNYLIVDADRAPQKTINYLNIVRKRHLIDDSGHETQKRARKGTRRVIVRDTTEEEIRYRYTIPLKHPSKHT